MLLQRSKAEAAIRQDHIRARSQLLQMGWASREKEATDDGQQTNGADQSLQHKLDSEQW